jgi:hypothetical protein
MKMNWKMNWHTTTRVLKYDKEYVNMTLITTRVHTKKCAM